MGRRWMGANGRYDGSIGKTKRYPEMFLGVNSYQFRWPDCGRLYVTPAVQDDKLSADTDPVWQQCPPEPKQREKYCECDSEWGSDYNTKDTMKREGGATRTGGASRATAYHSGELHNHNRASNTQGLNELTQNQHVHSPSFYTRGTCPCGAARA